MMYPEKSIHIQDVKYLRTRGAGGSRELKKAAA